MHQWALIHWKGWNQDGKLIEDSRKLRHNKPDYFRIGHYEVSKCWDIAVQQMKQGEIATVKCPASVDSGGAPNRYEHFGSSWVHANEDMTYQIEVAECALKPLTFREDHGWGALDGVDLEFGKHF